MEEKSIFDQQPLQPFRLQQPLQNATAVLVLGILSIVLCFVGLILAIIALVLAGRDIKLYNTSPEVYTNDSYNNIKAGKICAIIGLVINGLLVLFYAVVFIFALSLGKGAWH